MKLLTKTNMSLIGLTTALVGGIAINSANNTAIEGSAKAKADSARAAEYNNNEVLPLKFKNLITTDSFFKTADPDRLNCLSDTLHIEFVKPTQVVCKDGRLLTYIPLDGTKITEYKGTVEEIPMEFVAKLSRLVKKINY